MLYDQGTGEAQGNLVNINPIGIKYLSPRPATVGTILRMRMAFPEDVSGKSGLSFTGACKWCQPDDNPELFAIGMSLDSISAEDAAIIQGLVSDYEDAEED
jgi:hypothetical protein